MSLRVDWRSSLSLIGSVVKWLTVPFLVPLIISLFEGRDIVTFLSVTGICLVLGLLMEQLETEPELNIREGFLMVSGTWMTVAFIGALPYIIAGNGSVAVPMNALFESMSGFTTTGSTVMASISFKTHSMALMMWRQLSQWLGGMGIVVLAVAILPKLSIGGTQLMAAEAPGPSVDKLAPRIVQTARRLWLIYFLLTILEAMLLYGAYWVGKAPKMGPYNAIA
ncbi:MAG: potassium transporter TrkG, partial [bacterium]